jgi:hypothetical protein
VYNKGMGFENKPITFELKPLEDDELVMERLENKANSYFAKRPSLSSFSDISDEEKDKDEKEIKELKNKWEPLTEKGKFIKNFSRIYEATILSLIETNNLLGDNSRIALTSEWDDIKNGVDGVVIFNGKDKNEYFGGLEIDVTFSSTDSTLEKKIESIKQCIRSGDLPSLKYFKDPTTGEHKKISLPKIILGSQQSSAEGLARLWGSTLDNKNEKLKNHPIQSKIIMESLMQLRYFFEFAKNLSDATRDLNMKEKYKDIYIKYAEMHNHLYEVYVSKKDLVDSHLSTIKNDLVYQKILKLVETKG